MDTLSQIVQTEVEKYAVKSLNSVLYSISDEKRRIYTVMSVGMPIKKNPARPVVMARIEGERVIIEADNTDKPLVEALLQAGVPREKIVLAYMDEPLPETSQQA